jgi:uncharacterized protein YfaS (alpha-2-macroglobulin family)
MDKHSRFLSSRLLFHILLLSALPAAWAAGTEPHALKVVEVVERSFDGAPALAVIFSEELDPKRRYDGFLAVSGAASQPVPGAWVVGDNPRILYFPNVQPATDYTVLVRRGVTAANGSVLASNEEHRVKTRPIQPSFGFASQGSVLPARLTEGLPIVTINIPEVDIEFLKVRADKLPGFIRDIGPSPSKGYYDLDRIHAYADSVYLARFKTNAPANKRTVTNVPVEDMKELRAPGLYVAVMRQPGRFEYTYKTSFFFVSDIGLQARRYSHGMDVYAASLASAAPLPDVKLRLYDEKSRASDPRYTDAEGHAHFDLLPEQPMLLTAEREGNVSFVPFNRPALDLSDFQVDGRPNQPVDVFVYGPRDLYRPGETVDVAALLRDQDGRAVPAQPLAAQLKQPDGRVVKSFAWQPQPLGFYSASLPILADAPTGTWTLELRIDPASKTPTAVYSFGVEDFLPERMKLDLEAPVAVLQPKQRFQIQVTGAYLYGAPASGNRLTAAATIRRNPHPVAALPDFFFGSADDDEKVERKDLAETKLDEEGKGVIEFVPLDARPTSAMEVKVSASLYEFGGRPVTRAIERTLWPAAALIGIRPLFDPENAAANARLEFELLKADPDGHRLGARGLTVRLVHEDRDYYWEYTDDRGWVSRYSEVNYPVYEDTVSIAQGATAKVGAEVRDGQYRLEVQDPETGLTAKFRFRAGWWYVGEEKKPSAKPDRVELRLDKAFYRPGEVAKVTVVPPSAGEALVAVESDHLMWSERRPIDAKGAVFEIPLGADWNRHDLYVTATVLRPATAENKMTPNRAMGVLHLPIDRADRKLALSIEAPEKMQPERPLEVALKVDGAQGKPAYVTVAAVDVGVLSVTDYKTPDPFDYFFARRRYGADVYDLYGQVIERMAGVRATPRFGGDEGKRRAAGKAPPAKVKIVSLWSGPVTVDPQGVAKVSLPVPDFNGRLRIMAVAFTEDRFGSADKEITVAAPVVAEVAMPRFLGAGDRSLLTLELHNLSGKDQSLQVVLAATAPVVLSAAPQTVALRDQQKAVLSFPLVGGEGFGVGTVRLTVQGEGVAIRRSWELGVRPAYPGERRVVRSRIEPGGTLKVDPALIQGLMAGTVDASVLASSSPPINLRSALEHLLKYPYGCLEQTTSSAFPLLYVDAGTAERLGLDPLSWEERHKRVDVAFTRLAGMQLASGGFGLWSADSPEETWLTAYAADFLLEARDQGFDVPKEMLKRVLDRLYERLQSPERLSVRVSDQGDKRADFSDKAYAAYVLARVERAPLGTLRTLYDHRLGDAASGLALGQLGVALTLAGDGRRGAEAMEKALAVHRGDEYLDDYGSDLRDTALLIRLVARYRLQVPGADELVFRLQSELGNRPWLSTQERNALFLAGTVLAQNAGRPWEGELRVGNAREALSAPGRWYRLFDAGQVASGIVLTSQATFPLFSEVEVTGYPTEPPKPIEDPVRVERTFYTLDGKALPDRPVASGEMLLVHLAVSSKKAVEHGLLVDMVPAGLEVENQNLAHSESLADLTVDGVKVAESMQREDIKHVEYRDDRFVAAVRIGADGELHLYYLVRAVTPGTYLVPSASFEDMYRPEIRAVGQAAPPRLVVTSGKEGG